MLGFPLPIPVCVLRPLIVRDGLPCEIGDTSVDYRLPCRDCPPDTSDVDLVDKLGRDELPRPSVP